MPKHRAIPTVQIGEPFSYYDTTYWHEDETLRKQKDGTFKTCVVDTIDEALLSFEKLLRKGTRTDQLIRHTQDPKAVDKAFEMGAQLTGFTEVDGIYRGQLKLF